MALHAARGPPPRPPRPVPDRPLGSRRRPCASRRSSSSSATTGSRARRARRGLSGPVLRRDRRDDRRGPAAPARGGRRARACTAPASTTADGAAWTGRSAHHGGAKCALDIALHDLVGKVAGVPVHALLGCPAEIPPTDFTLGIDEPAIVAERAPRAARFPGPEDQGGWRRRTSRRSRRSGRSTTARSGSTRTPAGRPTTRVELVPELVDLGVELIEQPFPADGSTSSRWLQERSPLPIVADESAVTIDDLDGARRRRRRRQRQAGEVRRRRARRGDARPRRGSSGFRTFLGCMEETSVGIAASAAVASLADWVDLDGNLLLADDPFEGLELGDDCRWRSPARPGPRGPPPRLTSARRRSVGRRDLERPFLVDKLVDELVDKPPSSGGPAVLPLPATGAERDSPGGAKPTAGATPRGRSRESADLAGPTGRCSCCPRRDRLEGRPSMDPSNGR